jgi:regulation of enolase protein 1 (concanavalin A-like superfamily)
MSTLTALNLPHKSVSSSGTITIDAAPGTDLWRKPPSTVSTNAPAYVASRPISTFRRAQVTVSAQWDRLYDQGGLVFLLPGADKGPIAFDAWVKTGIEVFDGEPKVGTVATPSGGYSDWSLFQPPSGTTSITVEAVRKDIGGPGLYVYLVEGEKKTMIREVTWVFVQDEGLLSVGVYAARPTKADGETDQGEALTVHFEGLEIEWDEK